MFLVITAWRFADTADPAAGIGFFYIIPIVLLAASFGPRAALTAAATSLALVAAWDLSQGAIMSVGDYAMRGVAFVSTGLLTTWQVQLRHQAEHEAHRWFSMTNDLVCIANFDGFFTRVNASWTVVLGYEQDELLTRPFIEFVHPDDRDVTVQMTASLATRGHSVAGFENRYRAKDGTWRWLLWSARSDAHAVYAVAKDVTERKVFEQQLERFAREDALSGAANRRAWEERLALEMNRARRTHEPLSVVMIDFDGLKAVNDTQGHEAGDRLIAHSVAAWRGVLRSSDFLARLGGDEFCVICCDAAAGDVDAMVQRMRAAMPSGAISAGVATWDGTESGLALIRRADLAMYQAKRRTKESRSTESRNTQKAPVHTAPRSFSSVHLG